MMSCCKCNRLVNKSKSSPSAVFLLGQGVLEKWSKFTGEHPCRSVIYIKLQSNFIEIKLRHGCSSVNLLHIFRTPFLGTNSDWMSKNCSVKKFMYDRNGFKGWKGVRFIFIVGLQFYNFFYWNHTSAWVFSCKFATYFQNTFS